MRAERINEDYARALASELRRGDLPVEQKLALLKSARERGPACAEAADLTLVTQADEMRHTLQESSLKLEHLHARMEELLEPPYYPARCVFVNDTVRGREAWVISNNNYRAVLVDDEVGELEPGMQVLLSSNLNRVLAIALGVPAFGETATVERTLGDGSLLVTVRGESRVVLCSHELRGQTPEANALVQLDSSGVFALRDLGGAAADEFAFHEVPSVTFADIGGLDKEIRFVRDMILLQTRPEAKLFGLQSFNSILLEGKMGSGKTLFAQAVCNHLAETAGKKRGRWLYVSPATLKDMYYGQSEKKVDRLFKSAAKAAAADPAPLVIYFEEIDAYLGKRTSSQFHRVQSEMTASLLEAIDPRRLPNVWLMAATNRLADLDPAAVRAARFGENIITFGSLRRSNACAVLSKHLPASMPTRGGTMDELTDALVTMLYAPNGDNQVATAQFRDGTRRTITAKDLMTGAEAAKICRVACRRAALRAIESGDCGLRLEDLMEGMDRFIEESASKLRPHNLSDYVDGLQDTEAVKVEPMRRLKASAVRAAW
jgi:proteasome-associated ATPase